MLVEVGNSVIGVETHDLFEVGRGLHRAFIHGNVPAGQPPVALRGQSAAAKPLSMTLKKMLLMAGVLAVSTQRDGATDQPCRCRRGSTASLNARR